AAERDPYSWTLQGSTNGSTWVTIDSRSGEDFPNRFQLREFTFTNSSSYNYYRLNMNNNSGTILQLAEWELWGVSGNVATNTPTPTNTTAANTATPTNTTAANTATPTPSPTAVTGVVIPGQIEAEDYDSFYDTTAGNAGGAYRSDDVDIEACTEGGYNVGWIAAGEWLSYNVNVTTTAPYVVELRVAMQPTAAQTVHVEVDNVNVTGAMNVPSTGGWQTWTTISVNVGTISAGGRTVRIVMDGGDYNINWIRFSTGVTLPPTVTPTRTATPTNTTPPANTATPTRTPTPAPTSNVSLPKRIIVGYWHNFDNGSTTMRLRDVNTNYNVINVAFAEPVGNYYNMSFTPFNCTADEFRSDIQYLNGLGKKVIISIGGANGTVILSDSNAKNTFISSMQSIISTYGFNGIDIDLEGSSVSLGSGDGDFKNPQSAGLVNLIDGIRQVCNAFGSNFMLTMAPETAYVQGGYITYGSIWGAYLPVIYSLRDKLTYIHVQHYNSGSMTGLDGRSYSQGTVDFQVAMAEMLLQGFPVGGNTSNMFPALREDQVAYGLPAVPNAAGGGYIAPSTNVQALNCLITGASSGGSYALRKAGGYPNFRGIMTWSINWDAYGGYNFVTTHRNFFNTVP
ncbi:MAG: carbohydrate-binding protein, partial [Spirochaetales bacterium]|nr:carbohydrate-binding protein [Spirochaetales bacterium]